MPQRKLLTKAIRDKLPPLYGQEKVKDPIVHVKFFNPMGSGTWYVTEFDGEDTMFGYVTGLGGDELGYISLSELEPVMKAITQYDGVGVSASPAGYEDRA